MYKRGVLLIALLLLCIAHGAQASSEDRQTGTFRMPASLRVIEEEAFRDTGAQTVLLYKNVETIEDYAFADNAGLEEIYIPPQTVSIADHAFSGSGNVAVFGIPGSYANRWASAHRIRFVYRDIWGIVRDAVNGLMRAPAHKSARSLPVILIILLAPLAYIHWNKNPKEDPGFYPINFDFP